MRMVLTGRRETALVERQKIAGKDFYACYEQQDDRRAPQNPSPGQHLFHLSCLHRMTDVLQSLGLALFVCKP